LPARCAQQRRRHSVAVSDHSYLRHEGGNEKSCFVPTDPAALGLAHCHPSTLSASPGYSTIATRLLTIPAAYAMGRLTMAHLYAVAFLAGVLSVLFMVSVESDASITLVEGNSSTTR
jgi:hypothetical protein